MIAAIYAAILSSLLAVATSASAECAWVLWQEYVVGDRTVEPQSPIGADTTKAACEARLKREARAAHERDNPPGFTVLAPGLPSARNYICLPDSVDPRGPKGK